MTHSMGEATLKVTADTSGFNESLDGSLRLVRELTQAVETLREAIATLPPGVTISIEDADPKSEAGGLSYSIG